MPNIKEGCIIEYKYRINSPFYSNVDDFVFQHDIPIKKLEAKFETPEYFNFKLNTKGFLFVKPEIKSVRGKIIFTNKTSSGGTGMNKTANTTSYNNEVVEFENSISSYNLSNIPALKDEPYVNNINNYRSSVKYELSYTKFPNSIAKYYSTTWQDVVKNIYENSSFGDELDKRGYYEDDIDALISNISDPKKRVSLIFDFVKSKVKWNNNYSYYTNDGVKKAYKNQVGNVAEINLMLTSMLQYAGLRAYPVLISTRKNGVPLFPTREGYNYVVSCVKFADGDILLDATSKYSVPNVLPFRTLNWQGRVIAEKGGSSLIDLYPKQKSRNSISIMSTIHENGDIDGVYRSVKTDHKALSFRESYIEVDKDDFLEKLENKYNGIEISDYQVKNELDLNKPVTESYKFVKESQADIIGDKIYFSPMFFLKTSENPFKLEKREFPVDFIYPSKSIYRIIINIPEGYKIESVPEPTAITLPDNYGSFTYKVMGNDKTIQVSITAQINEPIIPYFYYDTLKQYFSQLVEKEAEQIVLTKG
ncbi:transglutaminase [uncultured Algibacter sp.]|uniref:transglutaminase domain-containing protein n=1 Tax=uncultured Algibacter sp. TaxID=298659 RepID=UPI0026273EB6|nr:transglutaminase [uncultured Algibacter sp.]